MIYLTEVGAFGSEADYQAFLATPAGQAAKAKADAQLEADIAYRSAWQAREALRNPEGADYW